MGQWLAKKGRREIRTCAEGKALVEYEKLMMQKEKRQISGARPLSSWEETESMRTETGFTEEEDPIFDNRWKAEYVSPYAGNYGGTSLCKSLGT